MKCKLCKTNRALVKAKVGDSIIKVCLYCAILGKLEVVEALDDIWEKESVEDCLEETDKD
jgi:ribosome-binding protein aMBF1 (putative translation factor)